MPQRHEFQDWTILLFNVGEWWQYSCCPPDGDVIFPEVRCADEASALNSARAYIQRMKLRLELGNLLDTWLEEFRIGPDEYRKALELLSELTNLAAQTQQPIDSRPLEPPSESPPDRAP